MHFTAPTVHSGFNGRLTLEIINLGGIGITLYPGMPICQLIIEEVKGVPDENPSQFQGQATPTLNPEARDAKDAMSEEVNFEFLKALLQKSSRWPTSA